MDDITTVLRPGYHVIDIPELHKTDYIAYQKDGYTYLSVQDFNRLRQTTGQDTAIEIDGYRIDPKSLHWPQLMISKYGLISADFGVDG